ncbi:hypothetical protein M231_03891 [Tremella mesenterica]|uniref:Uncharacterized protein n=1 Tax=Tremella mesenterica TaxID=5217 RepID=A0A4Q1BLZ9_TREME|nr:hypothetical protein M231_03891 [Tremella mesenterica]
MPDLLGSSGELVEYNAETLECLLGTASMQYPHEFATLADAESHQSLEDEATEQESDADDVATGDGPAHDPAHSVPRGRTLHLLNKASLLLEPCQLPIYNIIATCQVKLLINKGAIAPADLLQAVDTALRRKGIVRCADPACGDGEFPDSGLLREHLIYAHGIWLPLQRPRFKAGQTDPNPLGFPTLAPFCYLQQRYLPDPADHYRNCFESYDAVYKEASASPWGVRTDLIVPKDVSTKEPAPGNPPDTRYALEVEKGRLVIHPGICLLCVHDPALSFTHRLRQHPPNSSAFRSHIRDCLGKLWLAAEERQSSATPHRDEDGPFVFCFLNGVLACPDPTCRLAGRTHADMLEFLQHMAAVHLLCVGGGDTRYKRKNPTFAGTAGGSLKELKELLFGFVHASDTADRSEPEGSGQASEPTVAGSQNQAHTSGIWEQVGEHDRQEAMDDDQQGAMAIETESAGENGKQHAGVNHKKAAVGKGKESRHKVAKRAGKKRGRGIGRGSFTDEPDGESSAGESFDASSEGEGATDSDAPMMPERGTALCLPGGNATGSTGQRLRNGKRLGDVDK